MKIFNGDGGYYYVNVEYGGYGYVDDDPYADDTVDKDLDAIVKLKANWRFLSSARCSDPIICNDVGGDDHYEDAVHASGALVNYHLKIMIKIIMMNDYRITCLMYNQIIINHSRLKSNLPNYGIVQD